MMRIITGVAVTALVQQVSGAVLWTENFEGASIGATSGNNQVLNGTVIQTANNASCVVVDSSTDPEAAAAFTLASGHFICLSVESNNYAAVRSVADPISFASVEDTDMVTMTADIYLPSNAAVPVFSFNPRLESSGASANGETFTSEAVSAAGQYRITYYNTVSFFKNANSAGNADTVRPFLMIEQLDGANFDAGRATDFMYMDNIQLKISTPAEPLPALNTAYFSNLKANRVESDPLVEWQHFGPGMSGYIDKFWINNSDPNAMYDQLDMGNGHVTLNRGEFWRSYKDTDGNGLPSGITGIEFSWQDPDFGLMMAKEGIYSSSDRGVSWDFVLDIDTSNSQMHSVLTVDPSDDDNWYIGAGQHWMIKATHWTKDGLHYSSDGNYSAGFILKSTDRGQAWTKIAFSEGDEDFSKIIVDPRDGNIVYASCQYGVFKSLDAGVSWALVPGHAQLPHNQPRDMGFYYDGADEFLLYELEVTHYATNGVNVETTGGVYRSADGGENWENLTGDLGIDMNEVTLSAYRDKYYRAVAWWQQTDPGNIATNFDLPANTFSQFTRIAVDPTNKDRIYLSHNYKHDYAFPPGNIWMTENGGTNWCAAAREGQYWVNGVDAAYWASRAVQPVGANAEMAHVHREHYENDNTGSGPRFVFCNQLGEAYTCFAQQMMRSIDHGATWKQIDDDETEEGSGHWVGRGNSNLPGETFNLQTGSSASYLWGCGEHGLWRSTTDGDNVYPGAIAIEQLTGQSISDDSPLSISTIAIDPQNQDHIYMIPFRQDMKGELRFSADGGDSWETLSTPILFPGVNDVLDSRSLLIDHQNSDNLYFCIPFSEWERWSGPFVNNGKSFNEGTEEFGQGIYKSTDGGSSWAMITNGLPENCSVYRMAMDPENSQILYAALNYTHNNVAGGLYKSINGGASWDKLALPSGIDSVNNVVVHKTNGYVYIACGRYGNSTGGGYVSQDGGETWYLLFDMPYLRHFAPSEADPDIIAVNVDKASSVGSRNPGAYVTIDGGATWSKINNRHGQPDGLRKIEPDPSDPDVLWMSLHGTGFFRADISPLRTGIAKSFFWNWMAENEQTDLTADPDEDGYDNRVEYIAGSDPDDSESYFMMALNHSAGGNSILFNSTLNRLYSVDVTENLTSGEWAEFASNVSGTGGELEIVDEDHLTNRFYRIRVELD